jgi:hypothetical protein
MRGPAGVPIGELRRVIISNVIAYNVEPGQGVLISGLPGHPIKDIDIKDVKIYSKGGGTADQAKREVPEMEKGYPEPGSFGATPAYGFFVRHVEGLKLENIDISYLNDDQRPAFVFDDVKGAEIRFVKAQTLKGISPIKLDRSTDVDLFQSLNMPNSTLIGQN